MTPGSVERPAKRVRTTSSGAGTSSAMTMDPVVSEAEAAAHAPSDISSGEEDDAGGASDLAELWAAGDPTPGAQDHIQFYLCVSVQSYTLPPLPWT